MPILLIYGIPTKTSQKDLEIFSGLMRQRTAGIKELKITKEQVSIFFQPDLMARNSGEEIIVFVEGLTEKPERNDEVKRTLILNLIDEIHQSFPKTTLVECLIRPYTKSGSGKLQKDENAFWIDIP